MKIRILTKYVPPTDTRGSRIHVSFVKSIPFDHGENDKHKAAVQQVVDAIRNSTTLEDIGDGIFLVKGPTR